MGWGVPEQGWRKGPWTPEEDKLLLEYVHHHGDGKWGSVAKTTGLKRSGKSCRLRWVNYLRPGLKRGQITPQEEAIIVELHSIWGNKWSTIARYLPGRTDNEIKNYWRTHFKKKDKSGPSNKERRKEYQMLKEKKKQEEEKQQQEDHDQDQDQVGASGSGSASNEKNVVMEGQGMGEENNYNMVYSMYANNNYHYNWEDDQSWPQVMGHDVASESSMGEEGLWGGLWNLDDSHFAHFSATANNNVPNQNVPFSSSSSGVGGDPSNYRTGHI